MESPDVPSKSDHPPGESEPSDAHKTETFPLPPQSSVHSHLPIPLAAAQPAPTRPNPDATNTELPPGPVSNAESQNKTLTPDKHLAEQPSETAKDTTAKAPNSTPEQDDPLTQTGQFVYGEENVGKVEDHNSGHVKEDTKGRNAVQGGENTDSRTKEQKTEVPQKLEPADQKSRQSRPYGPDFRKECYFKDFPDPQDISSASHPPLLDLVAIHDLGEADYHPWTYRRSRNYGGRRSKYLKMGDLSGLRQMDPRKDGASSDENVDSTTGRRHMTVEDGQLNKDRLTKENLEAFNVSLPVDTKDDDILEKIPLPGAEESTETNTPSRTAIRWLEVSDMLPSIIPNARVLKFMYPDRPRMENDWKKYIQRVANELLAKLDKVRKDRERPVLYICHGVGGMILQEAAFQSTYDIRHHGIGYIFLNTPFPELGNTSFLATSRYGAFPSKQSTRHHKLIETIKAYDGTLASGLLWERFVDVIGGDVEHLPFAWLYRAPKWYSPTCFPDDVFSPFMGPRSSRFAGPHDRNYQLVISQIRGLVALEASKSTDMLDLLQIVLRGLDFPKYFHDGEGRSPLHLAASEINLKAVELLIEESRGDRIHFKQQDNNGQTPLHAAVIAAVALMPDESRTDCIKLIQCLLSVSNISQRDKKLRTAWDYVDQYNSDHQWILDLRRTSRGDYADDISLKPFTQPEDITRKKACELSVALAAEFHNSHYRRGIHCISSETTVLDLLYKTGPYAILRPDRPENAGTTVFKWIHFPANNEQWVEDLFIGFGIQDKSISNQRREGSAAPFRYLIAKAEEYTHSKIMYPDGEAETWPVPSPESWASTTTASKKDQSAVVLFMPILLFETKTRLEWLEERTKTHDLSRNFSVDDLHLNLARGYLGTEITDTGLLHPRRPLDQFSYTSRGEEQIMPTLGWRLKDNSGAPALMVDQLWLWVLEDDTVAREETKLFNGFKNSANTINDETISMKLRIQNIKDMLKFHGESRLLMDVRDIQDELNIVKSIIEQQKGVLEQLGRVNSGYDYGSREHQVPTNEPPAHDPMPKKFNAIRFRGLLQGSMSVVEDNIRVVTGMLEYAARIEHSLDHLLDLKQKQANALEARFAREGSEQTRKQGNIMLYWTSITIIFLPMSFLSSFFAIDVSEFPQDTGGRTSWPLHRLSGYLFGISFAVITPLLAIGFLLRFSPSEILEKIRREEDTEEFKFHTFNNSDSDDIVEIIEEEVSNVSHSDSESDIIYVMEEDSSRRSNSHRRIFRRLGRKHPYRRQPYNTWTGLKAFFGMAPASRSSRSTSSIYGTYHPSSYQSRSNNPPVHQSVLSRIAKIFSRPSPISNQSSSLYYISEVTSSSRPDFGSPDLSSALRRSMSPVGDLAPEDNHQKACKYIREAAAQGAELAVLPEYHLTGWAPTNPLYAILAADSPKYVSAYQSLAKELHICIVPGTIIEQDDPSSSSFSPNQNQPTDKSKEGPSLHNSTYFISSTGEILGNYRKKNIWHPERPYLISSAHDIHPVFDTPLGFKVGLLICWDLAFPEAFRELIAAGAEVIIMPTFWTRHDASPQALAHNPNSEALFLSSTLTARCFENTCGIIFCNASAAGTKEDGSYQNPEEKFLGMSRVVMPIVGVVGELGAEEGVLVTEMDLELLKIAEQNYKVREDIARDEWYYTYRHKQ
ncbi:hypothetical protein FE257_003939 [Aspergillus nanangensis]|uniref:CN hydrolase domain-containing protein n=1 Tax=Aspergillus nanangensis TaxID=2582783 RepID=A0AAD4CS85_ASPNN|nr:hypothetical protein FE257_003939 [Aspergillus nanangensis]